MTEFEQLMQLLSDIDVELGRVAGKSTLTKDQLATLKAGLISLVDKAKSL
jgi:hypothetical protein